jgi:hypothetical protein
MAAWGLGMKAGSGAAKRTGGGARAGVVATFGMVDGERQGVRTDSGKLAWQNGNGSPVSGNAGADLVATEGGRGRHRRVSVAKVETRGNGGLAPFAKVNDSGKGDVDLGSGEDVPRNADGSRVARALNIGSRVALSVAKVDDSLAIVAASAAKHATSVANDLDSVARVGAAPATWRDSGKGVRVYVAGVDVSVAVRADTLASDRHSVAAAVTNLARESDSLARVKLSVARDNDLLARVSVSVARDGARVAREAVYVAVEAERLARVRTRAAKVGSRAAV